jgi:hypothetical protein
LAKSDTSAPPALALELAKHVLRSHELVAEYPASDSQEIAYQRVPQGVADRGAFLSRHHDLMRAQHGEVLGDAGLVECQGSLELLHGSLALHEALDDPNPDRVSEGLEESRLERLQLTRGNRRRHDTIVFNYSHMSK